MRVARPSRTAALNAIDQDASEDAAARQMLASLVSGTAPDGSALPLLAEQLTATAFFTESTTALGVSAVFTGTSRDCQNYSRFRVRAFADVAGTLEVEQSRDGTTWRREATHTQAVAAGETRQLDVPVVGRYCRVRYANGAAGQATFELISAQVAQG